MKPLRRNRLGNERGGALVMVAISLVVLLGMAALAVDLTAGYAWRNEAQKIADSAALAGGSAFLDFPLAEVTPFARERAYDYALRHTIKNEPVDSSEVTVEVLLAEQKVRVWIQREDLPAWFAGVIGFDGIDVAAVAAAQAVEAGAARCLKPIALPDMWEETNDSTEDVNGNRIWDPGEEWTYDPDDDNYEKLEDFEDPVDGETGYGSEFRDGYGAPTQSPYTRDFGRPIQLKAADPQDPYNFSPGIFFPWRLPQDNDMAECTQGGGGGNDAGGAVYRQNICSCNNSKIDLGVPYDAEPGNMIGPTFQGISELLDQDPDVYWDPELGPVRDELVDNQIVKTPATESPRVIKIALFQPGEIARSGMQSITFNNFALMFLENMQSPQSPVMARFMYFPNGEAGSGPTDGSLVRYLRLVE